MLGALREYAVECSIVKVFGSETLDYVVDEAVQIFGGYGISAEYSVERYYRDSRVNRIFEGTNEINRLMISGMLLKRVSRTADLPEQLGILSAEAAAVDRLKRVYNLLAASANPGSEQEVLMLIADIAIGIYALDTAFHRTQKIAGRNSNAEIAIAIFRTFLNDEISRITFSVRQVLAAVTTGNSIERYLSEVDPLLHWTPINTMATRRQIAQHLLHSNR
jgi:alkylation response protein AidB-like acyl-CoA dehydrogenase